MNVKLWFLLFSNIIIGIIGQLLLKKVSVLGNGNIFQSLPSFIKLCFDWHFILAVSCYVVNLLLYMFLLSKLNLSYIFTIQVSLAIVGVFLISVFIFHEQISLRNILAVALIISGVIIMKN